MELRLRDPAVRAAQRLSTRTRLHSGPSAGG
jgi:hypothetical protein